MSKEPALITTTQAAARFGVNPATVRRWVLKGELQPTFTTPGGYHKFSEAALEDFANRTTNRATA